MLLRKFDFTNTQLDYLPGVSQRFEYFYTYWGSFRETEYLFFGYNRFENHRTMLDKIEYQLVYNSDSNYKSIGHFLSNPLFDENNSIIKIRPALKLKLRRIKELYNPTGLSIRESKRNFHPNNSSRQQDILVLLRELIRKYFGASRYRNILLDEISRELKKNTAFKFANKQNIQFLVNSLIVELYDFGYSLEYIFKISNIIVFGDPINEYPYPEDRGNFVTKEEYSEYIRDFKKSITIDKVVYGFKRILNARKIEGYYIFKVNNLVLLEPVETKIGEVVFYNPNKTSKLSLENFSEFHKLEFLKLEKFQRESDVDNTSSYGNALVKAEFISSRRIESKIELQKAYDQIDFALAHLNMIYSTFNNKPNGHCYIDTTNHFRVDNNKSPYSYNYDIIRPLEREINMSDYDYPVDYIKPQVDFINNLSKKGKLGLQIYKILSLVADYNSGRKKFSFKELWIAIEPIMKKEELVRVITICLKKYFDLNFLTNMKIMISSSVREQHIIPDYPKYSIGESELKEYGLDYEFHKKINTTAFVNRLPKLSSRIPGYLIEEFQVRVHQFTTDRHTFNVELEKWINQVIDEFYIERNMEVHKSVSNNFSRIKLEDQVKFMVKKMCKYLGYHIDMRNPDRLDLAIAKLIRQ
ncbi:hypothetical protein CEQ90_19590 [Lewinellaceae bacterium SD302]|nr:hypothetical protein CEQ90_19590 [Lewinellaceae bacterium SD302]